MVVTVTVWCTALTLQCDTPHFRALFSVGWSYTLSAYVQQNITNYQLIICRCTLVVSRAKFVTVDKFHGIFQLRSQTAEPGSTEPTLISTDETQL